MKRFLKRHLLLVAAILTFIPVSLAAGEVSLAGHWAGSIDVPGMKIECTLDFSQKADGAWTGSISIPAQNARDLPLGGISQNVKEVGFGITGIPGNATFKGTLSDDGAKIAGSYTQSGQTFPFSLNRAESPVAKAKAALSGFDALVEKGLKSLNVPGAAVAIVKDNEVIWPRATASRTWRRNCR
jgi:hypothetical protein